jgi:hypothetical protein
MTLAGDAVTAKFDELVHRTRSNLPNFTKAERMVWFIVIIRCDMDQDGFTSIFEQSLTRPQMVESIGYIKELGLANIASLLEQALGLLDANGIYNAEGRVILSFYEDLSEEIRDELDIIGEAVMHDDQLWEVDEKLYEFLQASD